MMLLVGAAAVGVILLYALLRPLHTQSEALRASVATKQRLLVNLQQLDPSGASAPVRNNQGQTLVVMIQNTAKEHGVDVTRSRPDGPDGVQITFGNAPFNTLMEWLVALEAQNGVAVESATFTGARQQGVVNGQIVLRR